MQEIDQLTIKKIIKRMYGDAMKQLKPDYFITLKYHAFQFKDMIDEKALQTVMGFLPNTKHNGSPFVLSVSYNKGTGEFEVTVHNPRVKA